MADLDALFEAARAAREKAYAPYSKFLVGAAIRTGSGAIFAGANFVRARKIVALTVAGHSSMRLVRLAELSDAHSLRIPGNGLSCADTLTREADGRSVRALAEATGIPASTLGGFFSGRHLPVDTGTWHRLLGELGLDRSSVERWVVAARVAAVRRRPDDSADRVDE